MCRHIIINCAGVLYWNVSSVPFNCRAIATLITIVKRVIPIIDYWHISYFAYYFKCGD